MSAPRSVVSFTAMQDATPQDMALVAMEGARHRDEHHMDTMLGLLRSLRGHSFGYQVDRFTHSLQTATRAERDGARDDLVLAALFHDIGDDLAPDNHSEVAAAILKPLLDEEAHWVVKHHGVFQIYHYGQALGIPTDGRERYRGSPYFDTTAMFCARWDQTSFDPGYDTQPLDHFLPLVRQMFDRPRRQQDAR